MLRTAFLKTLPRMLLVLGLLGMCGVGLPGCKPDKPAGTVDMSVDSSDMAMGLSCEAMKCENPDAKCCAGEPCVDTTISIQHCGGCNQPCLPREHCNAGVCTCTGGGHDGACGSAESCCSDGCKATMTDVQNCGGCGLPCKSGETCNAGKCGCSGGGACHGSQICCSPGGCADLQSDANNCGMCGHACAAGKACTNGVCDGECVACGTGETCCQDQVGDAGTVAICSNLLSDANNCGKCGHKCTGLFMWCIFGVCAFTKGDGGMITDGGAVDMSMPHD